MTDTPDHIHKIQLEIWLAKPPGERLRQFLVDNEALYSSWNKAKQHLADNHNPTNLDKPEPKLTT